MTHGADDLAAPFSQVVAWRIPDLHYAVSAPFDPGEFYPEYPFGSEAVGPRNDVYASVREVLHAAGLDSKRFGTPDWNPLGDFVEQGKTVLIKPNWVRHFHVTGQDIFSVITHPSVLRPLMDYAFKAVGPSGRVWVMDAPQFDSDFATIARLCQLEELKKTLVERGMPLRIADLRSLVVKVDRGVVVERTTRREWESEGVEFDLAGASELCDLSDSLKNVFGSDYDRRATCSHHAVVGDIQRHCYKIARRVLDADLVISVPKLKTHKKTGVTLNVKNMIGINTDKNYIPHYRVGAPNAGGDEFPVVPGIFRNMRRWLVRHAVDLILGRCGRCGERLAHGLMRILLAAKERPMEAAAGRKLDPVDVFYRVVQGDTFRTGNWWGNDTTWRVALDINKILFYGTVDGTLSDRPVRRYFSVIDGIVGGDEDGPMAPTPRAEGVLLAGFDPIRVDTVAAQIMGFDPEQIRDLCRGRELEKYRVRFGDGPTQVVSNRAEWDGAIQQGSDLGFRPHYAWTDYLGKKA